MLYKLSNKNKIEVKENKRIVFIYVLLLLAIVTIINIKVITKEYIEIQLQEQAKQLLIEEINNKQYYLQEILQNNRRLEKEIQKYKEKDNVL